MRSSFYNFQMEYAIASFCRRKNGSWAWKLELPYGPIKLGWNIRAHSFQPMSTVAICDGSRKLGLSPLYHLYFDCSFKLSHFEIRLFKLFFPIHPTSEIKSCFSSWVFYFMLVAEPRIYLWKSHIYIYIFVWNVK